MKTIKPMILVHAGTESTVKQKQGTEDAAEAGWKILKRTDNVLDSVESAIKILEDNELFDAGTGSYLKLDGSIQMDAAIMDSNGNCGAVGAITDVRYPISVARKVLEFSPHVFLVGSGALDFALNQGFERYDPRSKRAVNKFRRMKKKLLEGEPEKWDKRWKYYRSSDTVGALVRNSCGEYAAGGSTGGTPWQLKGRVGDTPIIGSGIYVGEFGAVLTSGVGEEIIKNVLAKAVYDRLITDNAQAACSMGLGLCNKELPIGVVAISNSSWGLACNRKMVYTKIE